jgi:hypothetical protein
MKHIGIIFAAAALLALASCGAEDAVSVSKDNSSQYGPHMWALNITGRADSTIKNVVVNRGCRALGELQLLPQTLNFGETKIWGRYHCDPIEVQVTTDHGSQTFTWDAFTQNSLSVRKKPDNSVVWELVFTSRADDSLVIKTVVVNRGHCTFSVFPSFERNHNSEPLKFGQRYILMTQCNPIEVQVTTDHGSSTFTWDN